MHVFPPSKFKQNYFKIFCIFKNKLDLVFWPRSVDQAVDRAYYRPEWSTDPLAIGACTLCAFPVDRPVDWSPIAVDRAVD